MRAVRRLGGLSALILALGMLAPAAPSVARPAPHQPLHIEVLSNRADLVSGDDALVAIASPPKALPRVRLNGRDVTDAFVQRPDGTLSALLTGLRLGSNTVIATAGREVSQLTITNNPTGGPIFSGPQIQPWYCLPDALDQKCNREPTFTYHYRSSMTGEFAPYDPDNPPSDVATTTTDEGKTVPYIVRVETGNMNRNQYRIAVLAQPDEEWTRWEGPPSWNHKVFSPHGAGCSRSHREGPAPDPLLDMALSKGFATMSVAMADNTYSCNVVVQAESVMMAKEHLVEAYGDVRFLMGYGCSGGSMAQLHMANAYPGLYDGLWVFCTFPDIPINDLLDCPVLLRHWENPTTWEPGVVWTEQQQAAAAGHASTSVCQTWVKAYQYPRMFDPTLREGCIVPEAEPEEGVYHPEDNPTGLRCSLQDYLGNILGLRAKDRWGPIEQSIKTGFANRPYDNVGVQYGLRALFARDITPAQFVDLNAKVGALDIDYIWQPQRVDADPGALATAYRSGVVNEANHLDKVAIIDIPGWTIPGDRYEIHDNYKSWALRERLRASNGHYGNHLLWYGAEGPFQDVLGTLDRWLTAIDEDERVIPVEQKVLDNRPEDARDLCEFPTQDLCDPLFGPAANPRWGAGASIANDVVKCRLQPLERADYYPVQFTDAQWAKLGEAFPAGVCDWSRRGVGQQGAAGWQTYTHGPGGRPLGPSPSSTPIP